MGDVRLHHNAGRDEVVWVIDRLWARGRGELLILGLTPSDAIRRFTEFSKIGPSWWIGDPEPVCVFGLAPIPEGYSTWFISTEGFNEHYLRITKNLKKILRESDRTTYLVTPRTHERADPWFKTLGFGEPIEHSVADGPKLWIYRHLGD